MTQTTKVTHTTLTMETPAHEVERGQAASKRAGYTANRDTYSQQHHRVYRIVGQVADEWNPLMVSEEAQSFWRMIRVAAETYAIPRQSPPMKARRPKFDVRDLEHNMGSTAMVLHRMPDRPVSRQWKLTYSRAQHGLFIQEQPPLEVNSPVLNPKIHLIPFKAHEILFQQIRQLLLDQSILFPEDFEGSELSEVNSAAWSAQVTCVNDIPIVVSVLLNKGTLTSFPQHRRSELRLDAILRKRRPERELSDEEYFTFDCKKDDESTSHQMGIASLSTLRPFVSQEDLNYIKSESKKAWWSSGWMIQGQLYMIGGLSSGKTSFFQQMVSDQMARMGISPTGRKADGSLTVQHHFTSPSQIESFNQATGRVSRSRSKDASQASKAPGAGRKSQGYKDLNEGPPILVFDSNDGQLGQHWIRSKTKAKAAACAGSPCIICQNERKHSTSGQ